MRKKIFSGTGAVNTARPIGCARGTITTVAVANLVDAETFTITDGYGVAWVFEFDVNGTGVTAGRIQVNVSTDTTDAHVKDRIITAINSATLTVAGKKEVFTVEAVSGGTAVVNLRATVSGTDWNKTITETVVDAGFTVTGMSGAIGAVSTYAADKFILIERPHPFQSGQEDAGIIELFSTVGSGVMTIPGLVLWGRSRHTGEAHPIGVGDNTTRGRLNSGIIIDEIGTDDLHFMESISGLSECDAVYLQPTAAFGGTITAIDAYLASMR
jgi:hypothetical protein